jgi:hypothetical protein
LEKSKIVAFLVRKTQDNVLSLHPGQKEVFGGEDKISFTLGIK